MLCSLCWGMLLHAGHTDVTLFKYMGPYPVQKPFEVDSVNVDSKEWSEEDLLKTPLSWTGIDRAAEISAGSLPVSGGGYALHLISFTLENHRYGKVKLSVDSVKSYQVYVDGELKENLDLSLEPGTHPVVVKFLSVPGRPERPKVSLESDRDEVFSIRKDGKRMYTLTDVLNGKRFSGVEVSADGKYLISAYTTTFTGGETVASSRVTELSTGKIVAERAETLHWMPRSCKYYYTRKGIAGNELVVVSPSDGTEEVIVRDLSDGRFEFAPTEDYLLFTMVQEGPKEKKEIYEIVEPDDRQPGWRNRTYLAKLDLKSGLMQQLTFGYRNVTATDISADGKSLLVMVTSQRMGARPTTLFSLYKLDVNSLHAELLVDKDGFIANASFSPDAEKILITGSPEALGGIGKNVREGQTPSMFDYQLFMMNLDDRKVIPLTRNFNPSVQRAVWSRSDDRIYFTAENRDYYSLYRMNPENGKITRIEVPEDLVMDYSVATQSPYMAFYGVSASNSHRMYTVNLKNNKVSLQEDLSKDILEDVELGRCEAWNFVNSRGDTIYGRYYLPPHFDPEKKYPMIVNYYGGCSPTSRTFESRYPHHAYAALGYVVYVVEPSGATGFGQEFSARHVNTFGDYVADDIIEGTKKFVLEHPFVNEKKIGCIGASYGGFMTQYLQTKTDIFAAAISHAGISDHTSYWGEGYWGYSYSEVSAANSYPWKNKELFVDHSPLFNADKIHTPLLFLHGSVDHNVPIGESIQMYTALKLLNRETAFVVVEGQDHHIVDYNKRVQWQNTIFAWFAKWLQDDPQWWETLYKKKAL